MLGAFVKLAEVIEAVRRGRGPKLKMSKNPKVGSKHPRCSVCDHLHLCDALF